MNNAPMTTCITRKSSSYQRNPSLIIRYSKVLSPCYQGLFYFVLVI
nr:MAG TPA: hypothetical protein [Caudoviricetes sp.]